MAEPVHLTEGEIAGFVEGISDSDERRSIASHLDTCARCRSELVEVIRLAEGAAALPARRHPRLRRIMPVLLGLAAGLAALVVYQRGGQNPDPAGTVRAPITGIGESPARIIVIVPRESAVVSPQSLHFTWHAHSADGYRFVLLQEDGTPIWSFETTDTSLGLPSSVVLEPGRTYFWRVDALADGISASSGAHRFQVIR